MRLSIIDQSPVPSGSTPADALHNTIDLARRADALGYERYWIAEHHATPGFASPAPEVLIARVAAETCGIRVGAGGILLPHYSPLKVAEVFRVLHALYPDRIDLGIGRAPGSAPLEAYALRRDRGRGEWVDDFPEQLVELLAFLRRGFPPAHPFARILVTPDMPGGPDVWLLGSSPWSAQAAAELGLPYAFAHFINPEPTREALEYYRAHVDEGKRRTILALGAICAETEAEAERQAAPVKLRRYLRAQGIEPGAIPTPEDALAQLGPGDSMPPERAEWPRYVVGTPDQVRDRLAGTAADLAVDELMILTIVHDHRARVRSYELLAEAFRLPPRNGTAGGPANVSRSVRRR
ncbi:MAG TPA: LLM class flavin-dependent oxidoreductase [bacterium]|nr:LLM class flavin-dependent oxidoreductase [bacterium]